MKLLWRSSLDARLSAATASASQASWPCGVTAFGLFFSLWAAAAAPSHSADGRAVGSLRAGGAQICLRQRSCHTESGSSSSTSAPGLSIRRPGGRPQWRGRLPSRWCGRQRRRDGVVHRPGGARTGSRKAGHRTGDRCSDRAAPFRREGGDRFAGCLYGQRQVDSSCKQLNAPAIQVSAQGYQPVELNLRGAARCAARDQPGIRGSTRRGCCRVQPLRAGALGTGSSVHTLTSQDFEKIPEFGDDALRIANHLPGTASLGLSARPYVRGGLQDETLVLFNDVELLEPFHLKDFQSVFSGFNPSVIESVDVYTGGFPVRYGDRMSGVMDIAPSGAAGGFGADLMISFLTASAAAGGNDGERSRVPGPSRRGAAIWIWYWTCSTLRREPPSTLIIMAASATSSVH